MTIALIDGDLISYRCSASAEHDEQDVAESRAHLLIERILHEVNATDFELYLGGSNNFRYKIYPEYKGNRTQPKPRWLEQVREYLVRQYKAQIVNDIEVDDKLGIQQTKYQLESIICSLDKDLLQIPGRHFSWEIQGTSSTGNVWSRPAITRFISPFDATRNFYKQLILGDQSDNIPGFDGKLRSSLPKFIEKLQEPIDDLMLPVEMFDYVCSLYEKNSLDHTIERNAQLLWILKEEEGYWKRPTRTESGPQEDLEDLLLESLELEHEGGHLSTKP